ncbi:MAG: succinate dehydrogenase, cytochrome b556 subunit [Maricaulis sp.]|uniref:succinate dehydrogenase, cytochrome b556 subunit n=1 Tax=Maricaulis sp. TaxID=1486257 RepID=UPI001B1E57C3|nr:succinate dehydrogenase, cytochrome b556 subunit [Maricaulis sp.]MBO6730074.1 succinate dehydrogenase, cytochrome b556 subunit [Maricaulis sp.]MBO6846058.1 succinate dehydrogenase, cytochrome b556 subunit [Maricaulis sp.]MBO6876066.1 succinate dehydrogenase, cytochrome b556 subunit [Maricaulis sp.]MEC9250762.1 succinate dehydrogenase, cytochrome b556 subunit [Pseudomonadota bacterium]
MSSDWSDPRPMSPHLQVWRWHATMASSILHRATGIANYVGAVAIAIWFILLALGAEGAVAFLFEGWMAWVTRFGLIALTYSVSYHWLNGLRHLFWDIGKGFDPKGSNRRSVMILLGAVIPTALLWLNLGN